MECLLRPIGKTDLAKILLIEQESFSQPFTREMFEELLEQEPFGGEAAVIDDDVIGYSIYSRVLDEMQLITIAVRAGHRRHGIGRALMVAMFEKARFHGVKRIFLEVRESNIPAQSLYSLFGFFPIGRRRHYYKDSNEDAVVMECKL